MIEGTPFNESSMNTLFEHQRTMFGWNEVSGLHIIETLNGVSVAGIKRAIERVREEIFDYEPDEPAVGTSEAEQDKAFWRGEFVVNEQVLAEYFDTYLPELNEADKLFLNDVFKYEAVMLSTPSNIMDNFPPLSDMEEFILWIEQAKEEGRTPTAKEVADAFSIQRGGDAGDYDHYLQEFEVLVQETIIGGEDG